MFSYYRERISLHMYLIKTHHLRINYCFVKKNSNDKLNQNQMLLKN
jgi:hypothetical protein